MLNYLSKERVLSDHKGFSQAINDWYNVDSCEFFEADVEYQLNNEKIQAKKIGFAIQKVEKQYFVFKYFSENEQGDLSLLADNFTIETLSGEVVANKLLTLGEAFEKLDIRKVQTS